MYKTAPTDSVLNSRNYFYQLLMKHKYSAYIASILILNFLLKGFYLTSNPIGLDEPFSIFHAQMDISDIVSTLQTGNNPPLYEILLHFWIKLFGISSFSVRFPSLIFSVLTVYLIWKIAFRFFNFKVAFFATLLCTFSNYQLYFSHEARAYPLFALLIVLSFYLILHILSKSATNTQFILLFFNYLLLVFTHYFAIPIILVQLIFILNYCYKDKWLLKRYLIVIGSFIAIYSFYFPILLRRLIDSSVNGTWVRPIENLGPFFEINLVFLNNNRWFFLLTFLVLFGALWKLFWHQKMWKNIRLGLLYFVIPFLFIITYSIYFNLPFAWKLTSNISFIFGFLILIILGYCYFLFRSTQDSIAVLIAGWYLLPILLFFGISFYIPIFIDRYLIFLMPAFYLLISIAFHYIFSNSRGFYYCLIPMIIVLVCTFNWNVSNKINSDRIIAQIKLMKKSETKVLFAPEFYDLTFAYHYRLEYFRDYQHLRKNLNKDNIYPISNNQYLTELLTKTNHVLFVDINTNFTNPKNGIYKELNSNFKLLSRITYKDSTKIYEFRRFTH